MNPKNKLAEMPVRPLLYTMAVPLMLSLLIQSLYNIVDSIFVAQLSETALTAASLVYAIQFLMIAIGVGTAVGLNAAAEALHTTDETVLTIASRCGFENLSYFNRAFKKHFGMTPREYRKK